MPTLFDAHFALTRITLKMCCVVEFPCPIDILMALSRLDANWYANRSDSICESAPAYGTYKYGKTPWMWAHVLTPLASVPKIRITGTCKSMSLNNLRKIAFRQQRKCHIPVWLVRHEIPSSMCPSRILVVSCSDRRTLCEVKILIVHPFWLINDERSNPTWHSNVPP